MGSYHSISSRFCLALIGVVTALLVLFASVVILINISRAESRLNNHLATYLNLTEVSLRVPMWNLDYETAQGVIEALLLDERVIFAQISIASDSLILTARQNEQREMIDLPLGSDDYHSGNIDITKNNETLGTLHLEMSRLNGRHDTLVEVLGIVLLTTLLMGAIALTSYLISRRYIAMPLFNLKESASAITRGDLDIPINVDSLDEIGLLARDFDSMRQSIKTLIGDLKWANEGLEQANQTLEERVADRTIELNTTTETFREILEYCPAGLHIVDNDGLLVYCNHAYREMLGYSEEEIQNMSTSKFWFDLEQRQALLAHWENNEGPLMNQEVVFKTREGNPIVGLVSYTQNLNKLDQFNFPSGSRVAWFYDISELKRAEEARLQSEQRLKDALESIGEGFAFFDEEDKLVLCNTRYRELLYEKADIDILPGSSFESILRNVVKEGLVEDAAADPEAWISTRLKQHANPGPPTIQHRSGNRWFRVSERRVSGGGTVAVFSNITELKRREAEAIESQSRLQAILDYAPVLVFVKDLEGRYVTSNRAFNEYWGYYADEIIGKTDHELYSLQQAELFRESDRKMLELGDAVLFEDTQQIEGKHRTSVVNKFPLKNQNGEIYAICAITSDVTEMKERERELKRTADRLELALSMDGVGIWDADLQLNKVWWSRSYTELLGFDPDSFEPSSTTWEEILHHEMAKEVIDSVNRFLDSDETRLRKSLCMVRADGRTIWVDSLMSVRRDEHGKALVLSGLDIDTTEQLQRERKLADANLQLETLSVKLSKYLSPQVYDSIFAGRQEVRLASKRKKLSVCFSDIVGFTEIADKMESEDLTVLINQYLTEMSRVALSYGATIDKFIGDAIMIFFGDPETRGIRNDAIACVKMAIEMQKRLRALASDWREAGIEYPLQCRIGINTDYCTVGNFGSDDRMDYTILGSGVNLASRLEKQAEPGGVLISYETYAHVKRAILCEESGEIQVKGIAYPVSTYRVLGMMTEKIDGNSYTRADLPHFKLDVHPTQMTRSERTQAVKICEEILTKLRS